MLWYYLVVHLSTFFSSVAGFLLIEEIYKFDRDHQNPEQDPQR